MASAAFIITGLRPELRVYSHLHEEVSACLGNSVKSRMLQGVNDIPIRNSNSFNNSIRFELFFRFQNKKTACVNLKMQRLSQKNMND